METHLWVMVRELSAFPSLWALQIGTPAVGRELYLHGSISLGEHTPVSPCCLLPEFRLPPPLKKNSKKQASQPFEAATVALSFIADLQGNKCCQPDPASCCLKKG